MNIKPKSSVMIVLLLAVSLFLLLFTCNTAVSKTQKTVISNKTLMLEIADTDDSRAKGLMFRNDLPENKGMLFVFPYKRATNFWMKNMRFNLDMIFLDKNKIVKILKDIPYCRSEPCSIYSSDYSVDSVIEVKSGFCDKNGVTIGTKITYLK